MSSKYARTTNPSCSMRGSNSMTSPLLTTASVLGTDVTNPVAPHHLPPPAWKSRALPHMPRADEMGRTPLAFGIVSCREPLAHGPARQSSHVTHPILPSPSFPAPASGTTKDPSQQTPSTAMAVAPLRPPRCRTADRTLSAQALLRSPAPGVPGRHPPVGKGV